MCLSLLFLVHIIIIIIETDVLFFSLSVALHVGAPIYNILYYYVYVHVTMCMQTSAAAAADRRTACRARVV